MIDGKKLIEQVTDMLHTDYYLCRPDAVTAISDVLMMINEQPKIDFSEEMRIKAGAYDQVKWERDIAVQQLNELGYSLGEKVRNEMR